MFNRKHDEIQHLQSVADFRNVRIAGYEKKMLSYSDSVLIRSALRHVEQLVRDKALAMKIPNGTALVDTQRLLALADSLWRATGSVSAATRATSSWLVQEDDPIAAVLGGTAD